MVPSDFIVMEDKITAVFTHFSKIRTPYKVITYQPPLLVDITNKLFICINLKSLCY